MVDTIYIGMAATLAEAALREAEPRKEMDYVIKYLDESLQLDSVQRECMLRIACDKINRVRYADE